MDKVLVLDVCQAEQLPETLNLREKSLLFDFELFEFGLFGT